MIQLFKKLVRLLHGASSSQLLLHSWRTMCLGTAVSSCLVVIQILDRKMLSQALIDENGKM
jgi:hypothetical protein